MQTYQVKNKNYFIQKLLGHGKGGYSYLVNDENNNLFTLKKIHHEPCSYYNFANKMEAELRDYERLKELVLMPKMIEYDLDQEIIVKEYIEGNSIYELVKQDINIDPYIEQIKLISENCKTHNINIDYFPTNFIVNDNKLYYVDYECNDYMDEWNFTNWGIKYWSKTKEFEQYCIENKC